MNWLYAWVWPRQALSTIAADVMATRVAVLTQTANLHTILREIRTMAELTAAALSELSAAIDEVASELDGIEAKLNEALANDTAIDQATADQIRAAADRLRGLRPDPAPDPAPEPEPPVA